MNRTIKITAGMTQEFEIIGTNAPDEVIEEQLRITCQLEESGKVVEDAYRYIKEKGYFTNLIGCQDDLSSEDIEEAIIDKEFDYYDYYTED